MRWIAPAGLLALSAACISEDDFNRVVAERNAADARAKECLDKLDVVKGQLKEMERKAARATDVPSRPPPAKINAARTQLKLSGDAILKAAIKTSMGVIDCELYPNIAPESVLNFVGLAEGEKEWTEPKSGQRTVEPLYEGTIFHRVIEGFLIQGGDPLGTGRGGPGYRFGDEIWPDVRFDRPGRLAMANSGPNTNGSQFFITAVPAPQLDGNYTIFGQCDPERVLEIMKVEVDGERPKTDVKIEKIEVSREARETSSTVGQQGPSAVAPVPGPPGPRPEGEGPPAPTAQGEDSPEE